MIRFEEVAKVYPNGFKAVQDVSFEIEEGEIAILVGPSGCGKTTSMKLINRLLEITSGRITIAGRDIRDRDPIDLRRNVGYVIQEIGLFPHMTVAENIATVPRLLKWSQTRIDDRVDELLHLMGLEPGQNRGKYPKHLSGGQRQRIGVARAMACDPPILLMDEPFGAIDPITRDRLQNEFINIQRKVKKTIVFVTHDIDEAIKLGDKVAIMRGGRLVQYDSPETLLSRPKNRFVADFVGADRTLKILRLMTVRDAMSEVTTTLNIGDSIAGAQERLQGKDVNALPVIAESGGLAGWLYAEDCLDGAEGTVADIVVTDTISVEPDTSLRDAFSEMLTYGRSRIAVVDQDRLIGLVTLDDVQEIMSAQERNGGSNAVGS